MRILELLNQFLKKHDVDVYPASCPLEAYEMGQKKHFDAAIVDMMMPGEDGLSFASRLKMIQPKISILVLTARNVLDDKLKAFEKGADDYLTKPFEPLELLARLKVLLRRNVPYAIQICRFNGKIFDLETGQLTQDGLLIPLSSTESMLLKVLAQHPYQPLSRLELAQCLGHHVSDRTVDVQIARLRRKIKDDPTSPQIIQTIRHKGYAFYPDRELG